MSLNFKRFFSSALVFSLVLNTAEISARHLKNFDNTEAIASYGTGAGASLGAAAGGGAQGAAVTGGAQALACQIVWEVVNQTYGQEIHEAKEALVQKVSEKLNLAPTTVEPIVDTLMIGGMALLSKGKAAFRTSPRAPSVVEKTSSIGQAFKGKTKAAPVAPAKKPTPSQKPEKKPEKKPERTKSEKKIEKKATDQKRVADRRKSQKKTAPLDKEGNWPSKPGKEWRDKIVGKAQHTGKNDAHAVRSYREAITAAKREDVEKVFLNRGYKKATGHPIAPNRRPDTTIVKKDGKVDAVEVQSASDKPKILQQRNDEAMNQLPSGRKGDIKIIKPTEKK